MSLVPLAPFVLGYSESFREQAARQGRQRAAAYVLQWRDYGEPRRTEIRRQRPEVRDRRTDRRLRIETPDNQELVPDLLKPDSQRSQLRCGFVGPIDVRCWTRGARMQNAAEPDLLAGEHLLGAFRRKIADADQPFGLKNAGDLA